MYGLYLLTYKKILNKVSFISNHFQGKIYKLKAVEKSNFVKKIPEEKAYPKSIQYEILKMKDLDCLEYFLQQQDILSKVGVNTSYFRPPSTKVK